MAKLVKFLVVEEDAVDLSFGREVSSTDDYLKIKGLALEGSLSTKFDLDEIKKIKRQATARAIALGG